MLLPVLRVFFQSFLIPMSISGFGECLFASFMYDIQFFSFFSQGYLVNDIERLYVGGKRVYVREVSTIVGGFF